MTTQERYALIGRLYAEGQSIEEISEAVGRKPSTVYRALELIGYDKRQRSLDDEREEIEGLIEAGRTITEIAEATDHDKTTLRKAFKRWGISLGDTNKHITAQSREAREQRIIDTIQRQSFFRIEYRGGFVDRQSNLKLHCIECGTDFTLSADTLMRSKHLLECPNCKDIEAEKLRGSKQRKQARDRRKARESAELIRKARVEAEALQRIRERSRVCSCGAPYQYTGRGRQLCQVCRNRADNKNHELKRRRKIKEALVDTDITLGGLLKKQGRCCRICGELMDPTDYELQGETFIAGDRYPSIDHIIPLSKGGLHAWNNVQVACRICNSLKSDSLA